MSVLPSTLGSVPIAVLVVDDQELMRAGLRMVLGAHPDLTVVSEADNGARPGSSCPMWC